MSEFQSRIGYSVSFTQILISEMKIEFLENSKFGIG